MNLFNNHKKVSVLMENGMRERGILVKKEGDTAFVRMDKDGIILPFNIDDLIIFTDYWFPNEINKKFKH